MSKTVVVVGATQGTGREIAADYARRGDRVYITGRDAGRAAAVAGELSDGVPLPVTGLALDLADPAGVAAALAPVERADRIVVAGMIRDVNSVARYDVAAATTLATTKLVGYTAVVAALRDRLAPDASVLFFGGMAKENPYPGSTTVSAVNAAVVGMVRTLSVELAPARVNAIHTDVIEDSPFWSDKPGMLDSARGISLVGRLGTMAEVVDAVRFLLEHPMVNGVNLHLDGGHAFRLAQPVLNGGGRA